MTGSVLVTGAAGGLGRRLVDLLRDRGWQVRALQHRQPVQGVESVSADLLDPGSLAPAVEGMDAVLHLAARTHARKPGDYYAVNVEGTRNLVNAARNAGARRFVFVSSRAAERGGGAYSESKLEAESVVHQAGLDAVIVRIGEVVGAGAGEGVDAMVDQARSGKPIAIVGRGGEELCPVHVDDVLPAIVAALDAPPGRTYTLAGECMTVRAFAERCRAAFGSSSRIVSIPIPLVAAAGAAARFVPLPLYPDQLARLRVSKAGCSPEARAELGFEARPVLEALASTQR